MFESFLKIVGGKLIDIVIESNEFRAIPIYRVKFLSVIYNINIKKTPLL